MTNNAKLPTKASAQSAGFDLYSAHDCIIPPMTQMLVTTDLQIQFPEGCYGQIGKLQQYIF